MNSVSNSLMMNGAEGGRRPSVWTAFAWSALLALAVLAVPACNTVEGMGEDVERGGQKLQDAAD